MKIWSNTVVKSFSKMLDFFLGTADIWIVLLSYESSNLIPNVSEESTSFSGMSDVPRTEQNLDKTSRGRYLLCGHREMAHALCRCLLEDS